MAYTKLHKCTCEDKVIAKLLDEDPVVAAFWFLLLAAAPPWGRLPRDEMLLKSRVCPRSRSLTEDTVGRIVNILSSLGLVETYTCEWTGEECLAIRHYSRYNNAGRKYHQLGEPEFSPPPGWEPPSDLLAYLADLRAGIRYRGKTFEGECQKFGVDPAMVPAEASKKSRVYTQSNTPGDTPREEPLSDAPDTPRVNRQANSKVLSRRKPHGYRDGDGDNDSVDVSAVDGVVSDPRRTTSNDHAAASAPFGVASRGGNGKHTPSREAWRQVHGPAPTAPDDWAVHWHMARADYLEGKPGPSHGYVFPPDAPPPATITGPPSKEAWALLHGPDPLPKEQHWGIWWHKARDAYLRGERGPLYGYTFPGQEVTELVHS